MSLDPSVDDSISLGSPLAGETSGGAPAQADPEGDGGFAEPAGDVAGFAGDQSVAELDSLAAGALGLARAAAVDVGGADVGDHIGMSGDGPGVVTHSFDATLAGYRGLALGGHAGVRARHFRGHGGRGRPASWR